MIEKSFIGVAGNIGVGKTTFTEVISAYFNWDAYYESVLDNPYLNDFYKDMRRWSFNLQIYFLQHRFSDQMILNSSINYAIQDRTIYEDVEIFARNLYDLNYMSERDWLTYRKLFKNMTQFIKKPDLVIYLKASTDTLLSRIKNRNRDYEKSISSQYLHSLNIYYEKWIKKIEDQNILIIDSDNFNIFEDKKKLNEICIQIKQKLIK